MLSRTESRPAQKVTEDAKLANRGIYSTLQATSEADSSSKLVTADEQTRTNLEATKIVTELAVAALPPIQTQASMTAFRCTPGSITTSRASALSTVTSQLTRSPIFLLTTASKTARTIGSSKATRWSFALTQPPVAGAL